MKATATKREIEVTLTLNEEEAIALWAVTQFVGGSPKTTMRRVFSEAPESLGEVLDKTLRAAGVVPYQHPIHGSLSGAVQFDPVITGVEDF